MLSPQEFVAAWGEDRYLLPPDLLQDIDIPKSSKAFLREAGLPQRAEVPLGFYVVPLPVVPASPPVQAAKHPLLSRYLSTRFRLLAYLYYDYWRGDEIYYAVEEGTGHVYCTGSGLNGTGLEPQQFVNSSLPQFAEFLLCYREFLTHFRPTEPERSQVMPLITSLGQQWRGIDPMAMAEAENYWPYDLEDMELQL